MTSWRTTLAFNQKGEGKEDGGGGEAARPLDFVGLEQERKHKWRNFTSNLEDECCHDEYTTEKDGAQMKRAVGGKPAAVGRSSADAIKDEPRQSMHPGRNVSSISSLYMQQLRGDIYLGGERPCESEPAPTPSTSLPPTLPLRDWVKHHANRNQTSLGPMVMGMGKRIDKKYLEDAADIALSLARKLGKGSSLIRNEDVTIENIVVSDTKSGDIDFIVEGDHCESDGDSPAPDQTHRSNICALGRMYYELFTQGAQYKTLGAKKESGPAPPSDVNSFDVALKITSMDATQPDDRMDKRKQPRRLSEADSQSHYASLQNSGVPPSLCRLIADMLANEDGPGGLFRPDRSVASISDVICDLEHMVEDPNSFLHDSLLMRFEPVMHDKLYGREADLHACLEMADGMLNQNTVEMLVPQSAIMISGFSGSGKSRLVREVATHLGKRGWRCLQCKFPQEVRPHPLSTITSAFDHFFEDISRGMLENGDQQGIVDQVTGSFDDSDMHVLCGLIPALRKLKPVARETPLSNDVSFSSRDANASKCRLHLLLGLLVRALSSPEKPLVLVMDDLQFADTASLEVVNSLVEDIQYGQANSNSSTLASDGAQFLFVGCYRSNEVSDSDPLALSIHEMRESSAIRLKEINLDGLSSEDVNAMVGDSLFYPRRLTRSLASLIHQKSAGNPLFVKEFLNSLATVNLLTYSLSRHRWIWDEDVIQMKAVSNGVADLLTDRLQRLPKDVLASLEVMSCFCVLPGDLMAHVKNNVCGVPDLAAGLDSAETELLVKKKTDGSYHFVHDMVRQTVYGGIEKKDREVMLKELADSLISRTVEGRRDFALFAIVDLINRVNPINTLNAEDRVRYANLLLLAGEKAIHTPDFPTAFEYFESGISFLGDGLWGDEYELSLALCTKAATVGSFLGKTNLMKQHINEVLNNSRCYEDRLESMMVLIESLIMSACGEEALTHSLEVLNYLGEPISNNFDNDSVKDELAETHKCVQQMLSLENLPPMKDPQKIRAMNFMRLIIASTHQQKSRLFAVASCRMVRLTISHGLHVFSGMGMAGFSLAYTTVLKDFTEGYKLGKLALVLNKDPKFVGDISVAVRGMIAVFKEPIQALMPSLLEAHKTAFKCGTTFAAFLLLADYGVRAFLSGTTLNALSKEVKSFLRHMSRHKQVHGYLLLVRTWNSISYLLGAANQLTHCDGIQGYVDNDANLKHAFEKKDICRCSIIITIELFEHFIFRRMDLAEGIVRQYQDFLDLHERVLVQFTTIHRTFYSGLIAFHHFRDTREQYWMTLGMKSVSEMGAWVKDGCKWNFENKYLLLTAELYHSIGNFDQATEMYQQAIASARDHRFIHEEAIANELASYYHLGRERKSISISLLRKAIECYRTWGAEIKANQLEQTLL